MDKEVSNNQNASLYDRLGGEPYLRELIDDIVDRIAANPFLEYYFPEVDRGGIKVWAYEYVSMRAGGPDPYTGPDLHQTFYSLNVRPEEYQYAKDDALFILNERGVKPEDQQDFLAILEDLKADILRHQLQPAYH